MVSSWLTTTWGIKLLLPVVLSSGVDFSYTEQYAAHRSDYYIHQARRAPQPACTRLLGAALDTSPDNATVLDRAKTSGCPLPPSSSGAPSLQIGPIQTWNNSRLSAAECPVQPGVRAKDIFPTPLGFIHASQLDLKDWKKTMRHFTDVSIKQFKKIARPQRGRTFSEINTQFFNSQINDPQHAMQDISEWPEMYGSVEYQEWAKTARKMCVSFARKLGVPLSKQEEEDMYVEIWAAVYPKSVRGDPITHEYHSHPEAIVSFALYVSMPQPVTPLTLADSRGLPPIEDHFHGQGDLQVDAEPPFHRPIEFYAGEGDIILFPSYQMHKVPPHAGKGTRVVWPGNCELPRRPMERTMENPMDGWLRFALTDWSAPGMLDVKDARPGAVEAYRAHAEAAIAEMYSGSRHPYSKVWEVQNQMLAMLHFSPRDAKICFDVGNLSARVAVTIAALDMGERDLFADTTTFLVRAMQLDPETKTSVKRLIKELVPKADDPDEIKAAYREVKRLPGLIRHWKSLGDLEFIQFLHNDLNGPSKCQRMCPVSSSTIVFDSMATFGVFSSRVLIAQLSVSRTEEQTILEVAHHFLGDTPGAVKFGARPPCWWRDQSASLAGLVCDTLATVWFADPRGAWPERMAGSIPPTSGVWPSSCAAPLGTEPKAPFHRHAALECSAGELMLFPAWLAHQVAPEPNILVRPFTINVRLSKKTFAGWTLPVLNPLCAKSNQAEARRDRSDL